MNSGCIPNTGLQETIQVDPNAAGGERYASMINLDKAWKEYTIRAPDTQADQVISGFATMKYQGSQDTSVSQPYMDYSGRKTSASAHGLDNKGIKNYPAVTIPKSADQLVNPTIGSFGMLQEAAHVMQKRSNKDFILAFGPVLFKRSSTEEAYAERPELFQLENL
ncbi:Multicopper oxidase type 2 [Penicillium robsamsonii]|uniref:Multicopper oxidase type 2 n=1 Tax=Penicillium robsamsonii TaxID=1792511 RepID=UPI0025473174|nr:Multicopper oxidase type 2 [Penicillium robsamsonii]KAJ5836992.1 Multicopper oxidase type 2 [Penicillium robsamsonii]